MRVQTIFSLLSSIAFALSSPLAHSSITARQDVASKIPVTMTDIWDFPPGTWVENLAVRSNGQILATLLNTPSVYQVDPTKKNPAILVHTFPDYLGCLGITELQPDIFYIVVGNYSTATFTTGPGSYSIWKLDMNGYHPGGAPSATKVADFPESQSFNGLTPLTPSSNILLIADAHAGTYFTLNVATGAAGEAISDPLMMPTATGAGIGINGVKTRNGRLYFTNTDKALCAQEGIDAKGDSTAAATTIVADLTAADDFQFDAFGNFYFAGNNELRYRAASGGAVEVMSNSSLLQGSTAVEFGRLAADQDSVYVSTNGGVEQYETRVFTTPGRIVRVDVGAAA